MVGSRGSILYTFMNQQLVGLLQKQSSGALSFQYAEEWLTMSGNRPLSLSLPLGRMEYAGDPVYNFFDNLLPDSRAMRERIQSRFRIASSQPFDLLAAIGGDCVGAIQLYPTQQPPAVRQVLAEPLAEAEIAEILAGDRTSPLGMTLARDDFRLSIAGAQEKTALLWYRNQWHRPQGATPTSHIFKLPIGFIAHNNMDLRQSCENEWLCLKIVEAFGLPVAKAEIQQFGQTSTLVVERFDRRWSQDGQWLMRLPQEDMCQALGISPNLKYQADGGPGIAPIMKLLLGANNGEAEREKFFRCQVVFWLLAASDGHAKNFSIYLEPAGGYRLTPIYDVISAYPLMRSGDLPKQKLKMAMALRGSQINYYHWAKIQPRHFVSMARAIGFSEQKAAQLVKETLAQAVEVVDLVGRGVPPDFPSGISDPILQGLAALAQQHLKFEIPSGSKE
jgi:serine/threonine-protein kinase HipA